MKCPTCSFITDPTKDLCGRCFGDLREQKKELGLPVLDSTSTYQELLAKRVRIVEKKQEETKKSSKSSLLGLFAKKPKETGKLNAPILEENIEQSKDDSTPASQFLEPETARLVTEEVLKPRPEPQKLRLSKRQKGQMLGLLRARQEGKQDLEQKNKIEDEQKSARENRAVRLKIIPIELPQTEASLWDENFRELSNISGNITKNTAIGVSSLLSKDSQAATSVYFDLAFEELSSPESKREFIKQIGERRVESIESQELNAAIGRYQKDSRRVQEFSTMEIQAPNYKVSGESAKIGVRLLSWSLDFFCALVLSLIAGLCLYLSNYPVASEILIGATELQLNDFLSLAIFAAPVFYLIILILLPLSRVFFGRTFGEFITRLKLTSSDAKRLSLPKSIAWNLLSILALISLGLLELRKGPILWREKILGARLLRT